jgi:hypothetical protein
VDGGVNVIAPDAHIPGKPILEHRKHLETLEYIHPNDVKAESQGGKGWKTQS